MSLRYLVQSLKKNRVITNTSVDYFKCNICQYSSFSYWRNSREQKLLTVYVVPKNRNRLCTLPDNPPERLLIQSYGDPPVVVQKETFHIEAELKPPQVVAKLLAAPVNPADINTIQGVYAIKPDVPFVPGNEGVLEIVKTGSDVTTLEVGDRVIPKTNAMGTWTTMMVAEEESFIKIPSDIDVITASMIAVNPCTAYRMLTDFVNVKAGDVVIQNCANSGVGQAVIQIAAAKGINTVNIVRQRENFEELKSQLCALGATMVIPDSEMRTSRKKVEKLGRPVLALNGASGESGTELLRLLANGGTMVTYGGMSRKVSQGLTSNVLTDAFCLVEVGRAQRAVFVSLAGWSLPQLEYMAGTNVQPVTVPVGALIFNDVILRGFWMTQWNKQHSNDPGKIEMLHYLFDLSRKDKLKPSPHDLVPFDDYKTALQRAMPSTGMVGRKQILVTHV